MAISIFQLNWITTVSYNENLLLLLGTQTAKPENPKLQELEKVLWVT